MPDFAIQMISIKVIRFKNNSMNHTNMYFQYVLITMTQRFSGNLTNSLVNQWVYIFRGVQRIIEKLEIQVAQLNRILTILLMVFL